MLLKNYRSLKKLQRSLIHLGTILTLLIAVNLVTSISYAAPPSIPNVRQQKGKILSQFGVGNGRTATIAWHEGYLLVDAWGTSQTSIYDLTNLSIPKLLASGFQTPAQRHYFNFRDGALLWPASDKEFHVLDGDLYFHHINNSLTRKITSSGVEQVTDQSIHNRLDIPLRGEFRNAAIEYWTRESSYYPFRATQFWYESESTQSELFFDNERIASWNHRGQTGVNGFGVTLGHYLIYMAFSVATVNNDSPGKGIAIYDMRPSLDNPGTPPTLIGYSPAMIGGYSPVLWGGKGKLKAFFGAAQWGGLGQFHTVDITDLSNPTNIQSVSLTGQGRNNNGIQYQRAQDEYMYGAYFKINMETNEFEQLIVEQEPNAPFQQVDASQFALPVGNLVFFGGYPINGGAQGGVTVVASQEEPDTRGPEVGFHIPRAGEVNYHRKAPLSVLIHETLRQSTIRMGETIKIRPVAPNGSLGEPIDAVVRFSFDNIMTIDPRPLGSNRERWAADTTYEVEFVANGIEDAAGNGMVQHKFRFSTGPNLIGEAGGFDSNDTPNTGTPTSQLTLGELRVNPGTLINEDSRVNFSISASGGNNTKTFTWSFDDGSSQITNSGQVSHIYANPGTYRISVEVNDGTTSRFAFANILVLPNPEVSRTSANSAEMALTSDGLTLFTVNPDNDSITLINTSNNQLIGELRDICRTPTSIARDINNMVWVACEKDDKVLILNSSGAKVKTIDLPWGTRPSAIVTIGDSVYLTTLGSGLLYHYSTTSQSFINSTDLRIRARSISATEQAVYIPRFISPDSGGEVLVVNAQHLTLTSVINLVPDTTTIDGQNQSRGLPNYLAGSAIHPTLDRLWLVAKKDNIFRGQLRDGFELTFENTVRALSMIVDTAQNQEILNLRLDEDNKAPPIAVTFSAHGGLAFVAYQGNNEVIVYTANGSKKLLNINTGLAPQSLLLDDARGRLYVRNLTSRSVSVFDIAEMLASGTPSATLMTEVSTVGVEKFHPMKLLGKQIFYNAADERMSAEGYMACATCHFDGGHDGRVWDFTDRGEGLRSTTTLRGASGTQGTGMLHWTGNFDEMQDFENDIRKSFNGLGFLSNEEFSAAQHPLGAPKAGKNVDLDALAFYVNSLNEHPRSPYRNADGSFTDAAIKGGRLFKALACQSCHGGELYTDSSSRMLHDVGTVQGSSGKRLGENLSGFDTPTLIGLADTAPYFHDGRAATLDEALSSAGGVHDTRARLLPEHRAMLVQFLLELQSPNTGADSNMGVIDQEIEAATSQRGFIDVDNNGSDDVTEIIENGSVGSPPTEQTPPVDTNPGGEVTPDTDNANESEIEIACKNWVETTNVLRGYRSAKMNENQVTSFKNALKLSIVPIEKQSKLVIRDFSAKAKRFSGKKDAGSLRRVATFNRRLRTIRDSFIASRAAMRYSTGQFNRSRIRSKLVRGMSEIQRAICK